MRGSEELAQLLQSERMAPHQASSAAGRRGPSLASSFFGGHHHHKLGPAQHDAKGSKELKPKPKPRPKAASSPQHGPPSSALVASRSLQWAAVEAAALYSEGGPMANPNQRPLEERGTPHALLADVATLLAAAPRPPGPEGEHQVSSAAAEANPTPTPTPDPTPDPNPNPKPNKALRAAAERRERSGLEQESYVT